MRIFENSVGAVVKLPVQDVLLDFSTIDVDPPIDFESQKALVTGLVFSERPNFVLSHSFQRRVNLYVYGDRVGQASISGIAVARSILPDGDENVIAPHGISYIRDYYFRNRLSSRPSPISITTGLNSTPLTCLIAGLDCRMSQVETQIAEWFLSLLLLPE